MPAKVEPTNDRELFERAIFAERFIKSIKRNPDVPQPKIAGALDFVSIDCPTKAEFAKRDADGRYVDRYLDAMWFGWQQGRKSIAEAHAAHAKAEGELEWRPGSELGDLECGDSFLVAVQIRDRHSGKLRWELSVVVATETGWDCEGTAWEFCREDIEWFIPAKALLGKLKAAIAAGGE